MFHQFYLRSSYSQCSSSKKIEKKISSYIIFYMAYAFRMNYQIRFPHRIIIVVMRPVAVTTTTATKTSIRLDSGVCRRCSMTMVVVVVMAMMNSGCDLNQPASAVICPPPANDTPACFSTTLIAIVCVDLRALWCAIADRPLHLRRPSVCYATRGSRPPRCIDGRGWNCLARRSE